MIGAVLPYFGGKRSMAQTIVEEVGDIFQEDIDAAAWAVAEIEKLRGFKDAVDELRKDEGDSVTILCDNPDGPPNNAVEVCGFWTDFQIMRYEGESLIEALTAAVEARRAVEPSPTAPPLADQPPTATPPERSQP